MAFVSRTSNHDPIISAYLGPMFAGKSTLLQSIFEKLQVALGDAVLSIHSTINTRDDFNEIKTHSNGVRHSIAVRNFKDLQQCCESQKTAVRAIVLDEAQFFDDLPEICHYTQANDIDLYFAALNKTYNNEPWPGVQESIHLCTRIEIVYAVCVKCKDMQALYSHLIQPSAMDGNIFIGAEENFESLCKTCFDKARELL